MSFDYDPQFKKKIFLYQYLYKTEAKVSRKDTYTNYIFSIIF